MAQVTLTVTTRDTYNTTGEMAEDNRLIGHSWFGKDNMRAFGCRVLETVYGGHYFVSSEQHKSYYPSYFCEPRKYTVRSCFNGKIDTVGEFQAYSSARQAQAAAREAARAIGAVRGHESTEVE
jgi:hypothetical protein